MASSSRPGAGTAPALLPPGRRPHRADAYRGQAGGDTLKTSNAEHNAIVEALAARDPAAAFEAVRTHIYRGLKRNLDVRRSERWGSADGVERRPATVGAPAAAVTEP